MQISSFVRCPTRQEGRLAIVTKRAVGCDGRDGTTDECDLLRTAKSCGSGAAVLALSRREVVPSATLARKPFTCAKKLPSCR
jgi:hypothetical protein